MISRLAVWLGKPCIFNNLRRDAMNAHQGGYYQGKI